MSTNDTRVSSDLSSVLDKIYDFVLKENRMVKKIYKDPLYNDEPKIFNYRIRYKSSRKDNLNIASGVSFDKNLALIRVLGEALERYSLETYTPYISTIVSIAKIKKMGEFLNPLDISPFSTKQLEQKKNYRFLIKKNSIFSWTKVTSYNYDKEILIPAQLISFNYNLIDKEPRILPINSTGTAFGTTFEAAFYRALCELIERDSFIISYLNKLPSPKINLNSLNSKKINKILDSLKRYKLEVHVLDLTTDLKIPAFGAVICDKTGLGPAVSIGLKAGWEIENCIISSIEEALMTRSWIRDRFEYIKATFKEGGDIETMEQRAFLWFSTKMIRKLDFWLKNKKTININENIKINNKLGETLKILLENNMNIIYKDITPKNIKDGGFFVIRVVIPQLQPLYLNEKYKFLGKERLYDVPHRLGYRRKIAIDFNKVPHPFL